MPSQKKKTYVEDLANFLTTTKHFVVVKFDNTSHKTLEKLRGELKKEDAVFKVLKNTLFEKTVEKLGEKKKDFKELAKNLLPLKENSALLSMGENYHSALSAFFKFANAEKTLSFKFGILDSKLYPGADLEQLAQLPGKEVLVGKIAGFLKAPQTMIVYSLNFNISKLAYILRERSKQVANS